MSINMGCDSRWVCYRCYANHNGACDCRGVRVKWIEDSFRILLSKSDIIQNILNEGVNVSPLKLDTLRGQLADTQKKQAKMAMLIENDEDDKPSETLYKKLKALEVVGMAVTT